MEIIGLSSVAELWRRLESMELESRFAGDAYPVGMCAFPFHLTGQGFFPGGDGLWRADSELALISSSLLPFGGLMFVGNDFGTLESYRRLQAKGYENPPTWRHLKARVIRAGLPPELCFCTNAIMGLRTTGTALSKRDWQVMPTFVEFCREFFAFQVETMRPKLVVVLGLNARTTVEVLTGSVAKRPQGMALATFGQHRTSVLYSTHPYGDFNFSTQRRNQDASELRATWEQALTSVP